MLTNARVQRGQTRSKAVKTTPIGQRRAKKGFSLFSVIRALRAAWPPSRRRGVEALAGNDEVDCREALAEGSEDGL
jgi:hypothetical protein